jgi:hypothetical protein
LHTFRKARGCIREGFADVLWLQFWIFPAQIVPVWPYRKCLNHAPYRESSPAYGRLAVKDARNAGYSIERFQRLLYLPTVISLPSHTARVGCNPLWDCTAFRLRRRGVVVSMSNLALVTRFDVPELPGPPRWCKCQSAFNAIWPVRARSRRRG